MLGPKKYSSVTATLQVSLITFNIIFNFHNVSRTISSITGLICNRKETFLYYQYYNNEFLRDMEFKLVNQTIYYSNHAYRKHCMLIYTFFKMLKFSTFNSNLFNNNAINVN